LQYVHPSMETVLMLTAREDI